MICQSVCCLDNEASYQTLSPPLRNLINPPQTLSGADTPRYFISKQFQQFKCQQLSSKSSLKSISKHSSSNSTMVNTQDVPQRFAKMHFKKITQKISISDLRKSQAIKNEGILSSSSSVERITFDQDENSIIDKLENIEMEEKTAESWKSNTPNVNKTEIFLPQPKHFMLKWKKD